MRYGEAKLEVHLYVPSSSGDKEPKVCVGAVEIVLVTFTLSHRNLLLTVARFLSPLTSHVREKFCPLLGLLLGIMTADNSGAV